MKAKEELTIIEIVNKSTDFLSSKGIESAKSEVEWILSSVLETTRVQLYLDHENLVSEEKVNSIRDMVMKRGKRIPLQHILGNTNFFGMPIRCDSRALVPRMETEQMVEQIVDRINNSLDGHVVDLGTGTGAILLSLCSALENCTGTGYDNSMQAIELARENLSGKKCEKRVGFELLDWNELTPDTLGTSANLVVSNPPYLTESEWSESMPEVKEYDPKSALVAGQNGLADIISVIKISSALLSSDGLLVMEIGAGQVRVLETAIKSYYSHYEFTKDLLGVRRFLWASKSSKFLWEKA